MEKLKENFDKSKNCLKTLLQDPMHFINDYYSEVIRQNDLRRELYIKTITEVSLEEHDKLIQMRDSCFDNISNLGNSETLFKIFEKKSEKILQKKNTSFFDLRKLLNESENIIFGYKKKLLNDSVIFFESQYNESLIRNDFRIDKVVRNYYHFEIDLNGFSAMVKKAEEENTKKGELVTISTEKSQKISWKDTFIIYMSTSIQNINGKMSLGIWLHCEAKNDDW
jgi:hypothetical protein